MPSTVQRLLVAFAVPLLLGGCSIDLLGGGEPDALFRFGVTEGSAVAPAPAAAPQRTVALPPIRFARGIEGDGILTARGASVQYIRDARWVAPAPDLFAAAVLRQFARRAPRIRLVAARDASRTDSSLQLSVDQFEARYAADAAEDSAPTVLISGEAALSGPDRAPIASRRFAVEAPAAANRQTAIVAAFDEAVEQYTAQVADWAREAAGEQASARPRNAGRQARPG